MQYLKFRASDEAALRHSVYNIIKAPHPFVPAARKPYHGGYLCLAFKTAR